VVSATARRCASGAWNGQPNRVFDVEVDPQLHARGGTGKHSPSDAMFAAIRLHADTASALSRALDVIRKGEASPHAAAGGAFTDFLRHFNVIQIFESSDKQVKVQGQALVPAERSLLDSGHLLCGGGAGLASGACKHNYLTYSARCDTSVFADNRARCSGAPERKPVCRQVWNIDDKIWEQKIECDDGTPVPGRWLGGGSTPECSRAGSPMCGHGEKLFETLLTREEMAEAIDMGDYFRVPADGRDLNYHSYVSEGNQAIGSLEDYHSHNSEQLTVDELIEVLMKLDVVHEGLAGKLPQ